MVIFFNFLKTKSDPNIYTKTHQIAPFKKNSRAEHAPERAPSKSWLRQTYKSEKKFLAEPPPSLHWRNEGGGARVPWPP